MNPSRSPAMTTEQINTALNLLRAGELVGIPTETVYGLAADASQPAAVAKIFAAKGRPADHPVIVHIAGAEQLADWAQNIPDEAYLLAEHFWPGPLTLILERQPHVSDSVTGGQNTVGLRAPAHPITHELLQQFGGGLAAPSANQFGHVSPTTFDHVRSEFSPEVLQLILDGGACDVGVESTIVSLVGDKPKLLRPGGVSREAIEAVLGDSLEHHTNQHSAKQRVSGLLDSHYAPRTQLITGDLLALHALAQQRLAQGQNIALLHYQSIEHEQTNWLNAQCYAMPQNAESYAQTLYATLRHLDLAGFNVLLLELPPTSKEWLAVHDRLHRAAHLKLGSNRIPI
ncbi:threonylcarbamoyl-AMP synthase [Chitinibacter bivalviorum]|uniref:Threonylcarbamoyl-AMP synthase n=1 Tax=Chitinibacter bivalviorum TaxID=2739434 RepID=A0A7H9BH99_9NEIS|nr:L-threonylcarbamoyladenylate synthase [Chitinibacter bivalviorum]QLG87331.1 threonylcarbamoyl-AMP synthase [Chitinibacter bivalviorum]